MTTTRKGIDTDPPRGDTEDITLRVSVEEANQILEGLGLLPFVRVYALVGKVQRQASQQLEGSSGTEPGATPPPTNDSSTV